MHSSPTSTPIRLIRGSPVVVLDDVAHRPDGCQVFVVAFRVDEMEGAWNPGVPVRAREVDGDLRPSRGEMEDTHSESYYDGHMGDLTQTHTHTSTSAFVRSFTLTLTQTPGSQGP